MTSYAQLDPGTVLAALDAVGLRGDGRLLQLNSYENRVFQVFLEDGRVVVAKFYRPARWSDAQILEEHAYAQALAEADVPVVAPLPLEGTATLASHAVDDGSSFRFAVSPRCAGRAPELEDPAVLQWLGRFLARLHQVGAQAPFVHRRTLDVDTYGRRARKLLLEGDFVPDVQRPGWIAACDAALAVAQTAFDAAGGMQRLRLHGDCHPGNILWRDEGPHVVDLDDACTGPAVQDLWMLLAGDPDARSRQLAALLAGYRSFRRFDLRELALIEPLRTLRMLHHSAWIAERWADPAFPAAFPWFGTGAYWQQQAEQLAEQVDAMQAPPLALPAFSD